MNAAGRSATRLDDNLAGQELAERLQRVLLRLRTCQRHCDANLETGALTALQSRYLSALTAEGPTRPSDLAESFGVSPAATSVAVQRLLRTGLVTRSSHLPDHREVHIEITARGREQHQVALAERDERYRVALLRLSAQDRAAIRRALPILEKLARDPA
ncbi:MarR family transcriptional regulator [Mycolicibacterium farcinogenes]|nr:MarR family transcriptional regulator [Mycolicibacterium farcinogenes]